MGRNADTGAVSPIAPIYSAAFIELRDTDIDPSVIPKLEELGYTVV